MKDKVCDGKYLGGCTIKNIDELLPINEPYTYENMYYIQTCINQMPKAKYKEKKNER